MNHVKFMFHHSTLFYISVIFMFLFAAATCNPALTDIPYGSVSCTNSNQYQSTCVYDCIEGYSIAPGHINSRICSASTTWSGAQPTCKGKLLTFFYNVIGMQFFRKHGMFHSVCVVNNFTFICGATMIKISLIFSQIREGTTLT